MNQPLDTYYIPLILGIAGALLGATLPTFGITVVNSIALAVLLVVIAGFLAYRTSRKNDLKRGGRGGSATSSGDENTALGGKGGDANTGTGGNGGHAKVKGNRSIAKGGDGGAG